MKNVTTHVKTSPFPRLDTIQVYGNSMQVVEIVQKVTL
jgi:hypothetical protein